MTTINELRQQIETKYLEPVIEETPSTPLYASIDDTQTSFVLTPNVLNPDEESLIGPGQLLELDNELVRVLIYDPATTTVSDCVRGVRDTEAVAHTGTTCHVRFPTRWPRQTIIDSIRSAIEALWQPLAVPLQIDATIETAQYVDLPLETVRILSVEWLDDDFEPHRVSARLLPVSPTEATMAAVQIGKLPYQTALCVISYSVQIVAPDTDTETITYLPVKWERIIAADVASEMLSGVDIDAVTQENLTESLRLDRFPVKSGASVSQNLIRYKEYLVSEAETEIKAKHPRRVKRRIVNLWG